MHILSMTFNRVLFYILLYTREALEEWLARLRKYKLEAQQTGAAQQILSAFTPRSDVSYLQALGKFDLGDLEGSAAFLDRVPFVKVLDGLNPRQCLSYSEQLMLRVLLNDKLEG